MLLIKLLIKFVPFVFVALRSQPDLPMPIAIVVVVFVLWLVAINRA